MKIAFIGNRITPPNVPGIENYVEEVSLCMAQKGHRVSIYASDEKLQEKLQGLENIETVRLPAYLKIFPSWVQTTWSSLDCVRRDFDVVHYQARDTFFLSAIVKAFCKKTKIVSSFDLQCDFKTKPKASLQTTGKSVLSRWNLRKKIYMLSAGSLKKESGVHFLIEAFKQLENTAKTPNNFKLVILQTKDCDDDYVKYLCTIAAGHPNIIILEKQVEKTNWQLFQGAQIYVDASYDTKVSVEDLTKAMLSGVAPLISDAHENIDMGSSGYTFQSKSITDLRDKLAYMLSRTEEVNLAGQKIREKMEKEYGWENIAQKSILHL